MAAFARMRQAQYAAQERDSARALTFAEAGLRVRGTNAQTQVLCARQAALGYALAGDGGACERKLADAYDLVERESPAPPWAGELVTQRHVHTAAARCWLWLRPSKAIALYESALREWPRDRARDGGLHQVRLALACAAAGERDRAEAEGRRALAIARATKSAIATRELKALGQTLSAN